MTEWLHIISIIGILVSIPPAVFSVAYYYGSLIDIDLELREKYKDNEHHIEEILILNRGPMPAKNVDVLIAKNNMNFLYTLRSSGMEPRVDFMRN